MPPKQRITREMILERSFDMFCREGMEAVNARSVAKALNCSTQPIFSYFSGMDDLKSSLENKAKETFEEALKVEALEGDPIVNIGAAYTRFAAEQPCLFKYLFIRSKEGPVYHFMDEQQVEMLTEKEAAYTGLVLVKAEDALRHMCIYTHGYASMLAGGQLQDPMEKIAVRVSSAHKYLLDALNKE